MSANPVDIRGPLELGFRPVRELSQPDYELNPGNITVGDVYFDLYKQTVAIVEGSGKLQDYNEIVYSLVPLVVPLEKRSKHYTAPEIITEDLPRLMRFEDSITDIGEQRVQRIKSLGTVVGDRIFKLAEVSYFHAPSNDTFRRPISVTGFRNGQPAFGLGLLLNGNIDCLHREVGVPASGLRAPERPGRSELQSDESIDELRGRENNLPYLRLNRVARGIVQSWEDIKELGSES